MSSEFTEFRFDNEAIEIKQVLISVQNYYVKRLLNMPPGLNDIEGETKYAERAIGNEIGDYIQQFIEYEIETRTHEPYVVGKISLPYVRDSVINDLEANNKRYAAENSRLASALYLATNELTAWKEWGNRPWWKKLLTLKEKAPNRN